MLKPFTIKLGGVSISLVPDEFAGDYEAVNRAVDFQTSDPPEISLGVHRAGAPDLSSVPVAFETIQGWQLFHQDGKSLFRLRNQILDPYLVSVFSPDFRTGDFYLAAPPETPNLYRFPLSYPMGELYMMNLLGTGLGMLFHASGVIYQGKGYLFAGMSSAGKTTTARLWQEIPAARAVNDDKVIVRQENVRFTLHGTPWHGEGRIAHPDSAPLARILILHHGEQNQATRLAPVQAASRLLGRAFIPLWDAAKMDCTLKFLGELCQAIPCYDYGFVPDASAVEYVLNLTDE